jgi:hypothetical protein
MIILYLVFIFEENQFHQCVCDGIVNHGAHSPTTGLYRPSHHLWDRFTSVTAFRFRRWDLLNHYCTVPLSFVYDHFADHFSNESDQNGHKYVYIYMTSIGMFLLP